jgi:hypothetical protein
MSTTLVIGPDFRSGYIELGFECSVSHGRSRRGGVCVPCGRSSPAKVETWAPPRRAAAAEQSSPVATERTRGGRGNHRER